MFGVVSGGHFNPAVTLAAMAIKRINPLDGLIYMLAQLSGGVLGALLAKGLLLDEGRATDYGAAQVSGLLAGNFAGSIVEAVGTFCLVLVILAAVYSKKSFKESGAAGDRHHPGLHRHGRRPADRRFATTRPAGSAPRSSATSGAAFWPYLVGPAVGALLAAAVYMFVLEPGGKAPTEEPEPVKLRRGPRAGWSNREPPGRPGSAVAVAWAVCAGSPSPATTPSPSHAPASATASTAHSPPTRRTSTLPKRLSAS